jgi:hypothetical protein
MASLDSPIASPSTAPDLARFLEVVAVVLPVAFLDAADHVRRVVAVDQLIYCPGQALIALYVGDCRHLADVEVHPDEQRLAWLILVFSPQS